MNPKIRDLWADALVSGFYIKSEPGSMMSERDCAFCVLGVLTDLYCRSNGRSWEDMTNTMGLLTSEVAEWASLNKHDHRSYNYQKHYDPRTSMGRLSELNDDGWGFPELAQLILAEL